MRENKGEGRGKMKGDRETTRHRCDQIYIRTVQLKPEPDAPYTVMQRKTERQEEE